MKGQVIFLDTVHPKVWEGISDQGYTCIDAHDIVPADLGEYLKNAVGIIVRHRIFLGEELLEQAPELKWVGRSGVGLDAIDTDYCAARGIHVLNGAGGNADAVGEHVIGMLLSLLNNMDRADKEVRKGIWRREANRGQELGAKTLGIIGYGNTGRAVAKRLSGFETTVLAYDKYRPVDGPYAIEASLQDIQSKCDIISFHVPLSQETENYFDQEFLDKMAKPFYLVNASRGPVCSLDAVAAGIRNGKILAAALDVLPEEPKDEGTFDIDEGPLSELLKSERVIFSPHIAGWTVESYEKLADVLLERIRTL